MSASSSAPLVLALAFGLSLAVTSRPARAQSLPDTGTPTGVGELVPFDANCYATLGRSVAGDFDGDGRPDVAQMVGSDVVLVMGPAVFRARVGIASGTDVAVLPSGALGTPDALLVAESDGLARYDWAPTGSFGRTIVAAWASARRIAVWAPSGGGAWILGVLADGRTLARTAGSGTPELLFLAPAQVQELELLDFDNDGDGDIALVSGGRLDVYDASGALLASSVTGGVPSNALTVVGKRPVWSVTGFGGVQEFVGTLGATGIVHENLHSLPGIVASNAADLDRDGDDDLVLSMTSELALAVLENLGTDAAPVFDVDAPEAAWRLRYGDVGVPAPTNRAKPAVADFDGDGTDDVWFGVQSSCKAYLYRNDPNSSAEQTPGIVYTALGGGNVIVKDSNLALKLTFGSHPSWAEHLELAAWRQATLSEEVDPQGTSADPVYVGGQPPVTVTFILEEPVPTGIYVNSLHYVVARYTSTDRVGPSLILGFQMASHGDNFAYLQSLAGQLPRNWNLPFEGGFMGDTIVGTVTQLLRIPGMPEDNPPHWN